MFRDLICIKGAVYASSESEESSLLTIFLTEGGCDVSPSTAFSFNGDGDGEMTEGREESSESSEEVDGKLVEGTGRAGCRKTTVAAGSELTAIPQERLRVISPLG